MGFVLFVIGGDPVLGDGLLSSADLKLLGADHIADEMFRSILGLGIPLRFDTSRLQARDLTDRRCHQGSLASGDRSHSRDAFPGHLGPLLACVFLISGLSYKTTFNKELWISSFPLYLM